MSKEFIVETVQIKKAITLINGLENEKFPLLIQRITQKLHSTEETSFKKEELEKLEKSFQLSNEDCRLVIDILEFIYLQAAYELIKPNVLYANLENISMSEEKSVAISELWKESGKEIVDRIRETKSLFANRLVDIKWRLNLNVATDSSSKQKNPMALFEFKLESNQSKEDKVQIEFSKDQLYSFYEQLEVMQKQIDALNG